MTRRLPVLLGLIALAPVGVPSTAAGAATPSCFGRPATIVGTDGPDRLVGQSGVADVIYAGGGDDTVEGGDFYEDDAVPGTAPDLLCGGPGNDHIDGGPGDDKINGGDGNDEVNGGRGADLVQGNAGDDRVIDESLADADAMDDTLRGGTGNDYLVTAFGEDKAYGDAGNDTLVDSECSTSYLNGGSGSDSFESWWSSLDGAPCASADDVIDGGDGADRATASTNDSVLDVESVTRV
jgi:Ca2+-binding RTX toxin-like protein